MRQRPGYIHTRGRKFHIHIAGGYIGRFTFSDTDSYGSTGFHFNAGATLALIAPEHRGLSDN